MSDANKVLTRCAWAGNTAFDDTYGSEWSGLGPCPGVFATKGDLAGALEQFCADAAAAEETYGTIGSWDVSAVTDMEGLIFKRGCKATFNADISGWDTSRVTTMADMFYVRPARAPASTTSAVGILPAHAACAAAGPRAPTVARPRMPPLFPHMVPFRRGRPRRRSTSR